MKYRPVVLDGDHVTDVHRQTFPTRDEALLAARSAERFLAYARALTGGCYSIRVAIREEPDESEVTP
jgi:hypothetical protein